MEPVSSMRQLVPTSHLKAKMLESCYAAVAALPTRSD